MRAHARHGRQVLERTQFGWQMFKHRPGVPAGAPAARKAHHSCKVDRAFCIRHRNHRSQQREPRAIFDAWAHDGRPQPANRLPQLSCERARGPVRLVAFCTGPCRTEKGNCSVPVVPYDRRERTIPPRSCIGRIGETHQAPSNQIRLECTIDDDTCWQCPIASQPSYGQGRFLCDVPQGTSR